MAESQQSVSDLAADANSRAKAAVAKMREEHRERLLRVIDRRLPYLLRKRFSAEDILQNMYLEGVRRYPKFVAKEPPVRPYVWLHGLALTCISEAFKHAMRERRRANRDRSWPDASSVILLPPDSVTGPSTALRRQEIREAVRKVLASLSKQHREILQLRKLDELDFDEIAELLGIARNAAFQRLHRALKAFRETWKNLFPQWSVSHVS